MTSPSFDARLRELVDPARVKRDAALAPLTTFRVGGVADWLVEIEDTDELVAVLDEATRAGVPIALLGGGSNVVVADEGVRGVVIRLRLLGISHPEPGIVRAEAGATINGLVRWTVGRGLAGVEEWAGTPGTVGGAIYGNAHWRGRNIGDLVRNVMLATPSGELSIVSAREMAFDYDTSRLKHTGEVLVWAEFDVTPGQPDALRAKARESLAYRKSTQPLHMPSAGCVFQNPDPRVDRVPDGIPASAGALVDRAGLKGHRVGGASISLTHGNFIINEGTATAQDIRSLIELARREVHARFGVALRDEVVYLGTFRHG